MTPIKRAAKPGRPKKKAAPAKRPGRPKLDRRSVQRTLEDDYDPWLLVVGRLDDTNGAKATTVVLSTENDARQVAELLGTLGHKSHVFRLADGR